MTLIVVLGGPRSSKSELAERLAADAALPVHHLRPRALATVQSGDAAIGERRDVTRLEEAGDSTVVIDDLEAFVRDHTGASDRVELVDMAIDALVRRDGLTVVVADDLDGAGDPPDVDRVWSELLARAMQRLTAAADRLLLAVAGRPVEVPSVREATPAESDELRNQTDVVVAAGTEDFANIVVDEGPPEWMQTVLRDALEQDVRRYPDEREAMAAIAARHGRSPEEVVLTNGAVDAFWLLAATFRPRHAACVGPTFSEPEVALGAYGHQVERVARDRAAGFALDAATVPEGADYVTIGNPNNPTGTLDPAATVRSLARPGRLVIVDEAFMEFVPGERESLASESLPGVVVLRSIGKLLSIPGLRAGYMLAPPDIAARLRPRRAKWAVNTLALAALTAWSNRPGAGEEIARRVGRWRRSLAKRLDEIDGVVVYPSAANFVLATVPDGPAVVSQLAELGFAVRPAGSFPGLSPNDLRVTIRSATANGRLADAMSVAVSAAT